MAIATQTGAGWDVPEVDATLILPEGGNPDEVLAKRSALDRDVKWQASTIPVIPAGSIGSAKLAPMTTKTYLGRTTAGTGPVEAVPAATMLTDLGAQAALVGSGAGQNIKTINGSALPGTGNLVVGGNVAADALFTAAGDLAVGSGASTAAKLAKGSALQVLRVKADGTTLEYAAPSVPVSTGVTGLASGVSAFLQTPSSANLAAAVSDEDGTGALLFAKAAVALTGANTLTQAAHFNRSLTWTGSSTAAQALSPTATESDFVELSNNGTAAVTFTGCTFAGGYELQALPGETFQAKYTGGAWVSEKMVPAYLSKINSQSAAYTLVAADVGATIYHPSADTTARVWTIPANASVPFPTGTTVTFDNDDGAGAITIAITTDTLVLVGSAGSTGSRTLAEGGRAVAQKVTATRWRISGSVELT